MRFFSEFTHSSVALAVGTTLGLSSFGLSVLPSQAATTLPQISIKDAHVKEGNAGLTSLPFIVELTKTPTTAVSVNYQTLGRTASSNSDFVSAKGTLNFAAGVKSRVLNIQVKGDTKAEANETLYVRLSKVVGASFRDAEAVGTIINDDGDIKPGAGEGKIAYLSREFGTAGIYVMNSDGSNKTQLTTNSNDANPTWSPDGKKIAFRTYDSNSSGYPAVAVINADGTNRTIVFIDRSYSITTTNGVKWSGDSKALLYNDFTTSAGLVSAPIDGGIPTTLTTDNDDSAPSASVTGNLITFSSIDDTTNKSQIYTISAKGTNRTKLTSTTDVGCVLPLISADGSVIAYQQRGFQGTAVHAMNSDGSKDKFVVQVVDSDSDNSDSDTDGQSSRSALSLDGTKLAFTNLFQTVYTTYVCDLKTNIVFEFKDDRAPDFSPDGSRIVFRSGISGNAEIYTMASNGGKIVRLTNNSVTDANPDFAAGTVPVPTTTSSSTSSKNAVLPSANGS